MTRLAACWRAIAWWLGGVLGEHRYHNYLAHHHRHGHGRPMTEAEFWRSEYARASSQPSNRCC